MKKGILVKSKTTNDAFLFTKGNHSVGVVINGEWREMRNYFNYPMDLITLKKSIRLYFSFNLKEYEVKILKEQYND